MPLQPQRTNIPISGGLQGDEAPEYIDPPALFICDNFYHSKKSTLLKRRGYFQTQLRTMPGVDTGGNPDDSPDWPSVPNPIVGTLGLDRFIDAGNNCIVAGSGYLWSYDPSAFEGKSPTTRPNGSRICEIPDLAIAERQIKGIPDATRGPYITEYSKSYQCAAGAMNADGLLVSTYVINPGAPDTNGMEWHCRISDPENSSIDIDIVSNIPDTHGGSSLGTSFVNPVCLWFSGGALVAIFCTDTIVMQWFSLATMTWAPTNKYLMSAHNVQHYDIALQNYATNTFAVAWIDTDGYVNCGSYYAGTWTVSGFVSRRITTGTITYSALNPNGLCIACSADGHVGVAYSAKTVVAGGGGDGSYVRAIRLQSFTAAGVQVIPEMTVATTTLTSNAVSVAALNPVNSTARWSVSWVRDQTVMASLGSVQAVAIAGANTARPAVYARTVNADGTLRGPLKEFPSCSMASSAFGIQGCAYQVLKLELPESIGPVHQTINDCPWVLVRLYNELDQDDLQQARLARPLSAWGYGRPMSFFQPPKMPLIGTTKAAGVMMQAISNNGTNVQSGEALWLETFDRAALDRYESVPLPNGGSLFGCGSPWVFDGSTSFESAFITRPILSGFYRASFDPLGIGDQSEYLQRYDAGNAANAVLFKTIFIHRDSAGRTTYSAPSDVYTATLPLDGETTYTYLGHSDWMQTRTLIVSGLFLTARPGNIVCAIYVSNDGSSFAQLMSVPITTFDPNADTPVQAIDIKIVLKNSSNYGASTPAPAISFPLPAYSSPAPYTQDGTLPSGYPQLARHVIRWNNRIWLANNHQVSHSREFTEGDQPAFPSDFSEYLDREVTGISPLDDRALLFSTDAVLSRSGEGPNDAGLNSSYSNWNFITHEIGCINARSIVYTMIGVFFQSRRGIERFGNDGSIVHVREIENYFDEGPTIEASDVVLGSLSLPRDRQLRLFYGSRARDALEVLTLDYWTGTWSHWYFASPTPLGSAWGGLFGGDITVNGDQVYLSTPSGWVASEQLHHYDTVESAVAPPVYFQRKNYHIPWSIVSPWLKTEGLQGFNRIWYTTLMFRAAGWTNVFGVLPQFGVTVDIKTDYLNDLERHGSRSIADLQRMRDGTGIVYLRVHHQHQQCRSMQVSLSSNDLQAFDGDPSGLTELSGIFIEYGTEPGTGRLPISGKM